MLAQPDNTAMAKMASSLVIQYLVVDGSDAELYLKGHC